MKHHALLSVVFVVLAAVVYATEENSVTSVELSWPDRFTTTVESNPNLNPGHYVTYFYDNINHRERIESDHNSVTIRSKKDNSSIEIRWDKTHVTLPVKCEEKTLNDWSLMPKDWFSQFNKTLVSVNTALPDYNRNFAAVTFQWRFRVKAAQLASLFFVPKTVPGDQNNRYGALLAEVPITKVKNIIVTVTSSVFDPSWPELWSIKYKLHDVPNSHHYLKGFDVTLKKASIDELVPLYFDKLFEVPTYIDECTRPNPPTQTFEDEEEDF